jgi:ABC-type lipoprotein export system ATPase subunit
MPVSTITILGGCGKNGRKERVRRVTLSMGGIISIVGPTGSGKTTLINDIELFANKNTPSGRRVLMNGVVFPDDLMSHPSRNPIALISQHTNFLSDLPVKDFLRIHAQIRKSGGRGDVVRQTLDFANRLTGEPIIKESAMTELSGGQTRALLIADAVVIGNSPIILLDEIENAGIHRIKAMELLRKYRKIFVFVTHDPRIALISDFRIIMKNGAMEKVIATGAEEKAVVEEIKKLDDFMLGLRSRIRAGECLMRREFYRGMRRIGYNREALT